VIGGYDGMASGTVQNDEQYIYVQYCTIQNIRSATWCNGILIKCWHTDIKNIFIKHNTISNIGNHGIALYPWRTGDGGNGGAHLISNITISYNDVSLCGRSEDTISSCIMAAIGTKNSIIEHNTLTGGGDGDAPGIAIGGGTEGDYPEGLIIRYNYINCQSGEQAIVISQGGDITCDVYYNILFSDNISTIEIFASGSPNYTNASMRFYNNTIFTSTLYGAFKNAATIASCATFKNNICYSTVAGQYTSPCITCVTANNTVHSNNLMYKTETATHCYHATNGGTNYDRTDVLTWEATAKITDPVFVTNFTNLNLQAGSPAIGVGVDLKLPHDYDGNAILNPPAIGAYERPLGSSVWKSQAKNFFTN
jgi:hypothetical protein